MDIEKRDEFVRIVRNAKQRKREWEIKVADKLKTLQNELDNRQTRINTACHE
ncbi:MAG: hypothetical protein J6B33_00250 [Prevotella sp.]|nr:hypothetical protein [Prevotella sp.]